MRSLDLSAGGAVMSSKEGIGGVWLILYHHHGIGFDQCGARGKATPTAARAGNGSEKWLAIVSLTLAMRWESWNRIQLDDIGE